MAYITASNDQKEQIKNNSNFPIQVKWAIINLALYWKNNTGVNIADAVSAKRWATHRSYGAQILDNPNQVDSNIGYWVGLVASYLDNYSIVNDQVQFDPNVVVQYMVQQGTFQNIADVIFDAKCAGLIF